MRYKLNLEGQRFGKLLVISRAKNVKTCSTWKCKCDCGNEKIAFTIRLRNGQCSSCGCLLREQMKTRFRKHGKSGTIEYKLLKYARKRSIEFNREFSIELSDIIIPTYCPILNIPLVSSCGGNPTNNSPSLDRIDSSKGYIKGNVKIISMRANRLKQDSSIDELRSIIRYMEEKI
jgi:hypothetical protein